jgi:hypothetical protein
MLQNHICAAAVRIEREVDVNSMMVHDMPLWPLLRTSLHFQLGKMDQTIRAEHTDELQAVLDSLAPLPAIPPAPEVGGARPAAARPGSSDLVLFFTRAEEHGLGADGFRYTNKLLDPIIELVSPRLPTLKLEMLRAAPEATAPRNEETVYLYFPDSAMQRVQRDIGFPNTLKIDVAALAPAMALLTRHYPAHGINPAGLVHMSGAILALADQYERLLKRLRPRAVVLVCWYYWIAMALTLACRRLGIPTIEVQHGLNGAFHSAYTYWTAIPEQGYATMPNWFVSWGNLGSRYAATSPRPKSSGHSVIAGGHIGMARQRASAKPGPAALGFHARLAKYARRIVIAAQPIVTPLPDFLAEAVRRSPPNWSWMLRRHPAQAESIADLEKYVAAAGCARISVGEPSTMPLTDVLTGATHVLTAHSTVAHDAILWNRPVGFTFETGPTTFPELIQAGVARGLESAEDVLDFIENCRSPIEVSEDMLLYTRRADVIQRGWRHVLGLEETA